MAAAASAGLDVPGLDPAGLHLNARLCHILESRFPEVLDLPAGESCQLVLVTHSRPDAPLALSVFADGSAAASGTQPLNLTSSGLPTSSASLLVSSVATLWSSTTAVTQPTLTLTQLHRAPPAALTPTQLMRRFANPKSPTAVGPHHRAPALPPSQPYACPQPEENGHDTVSAILRLSLPLETVSDEEISRIAKS